MSCTFDTLLLQLVFQQIIPNKFPTNIQTKFNQTPPCHVLLFHFTSTCIPTNNSKMNSHKYSNRGQPNPTMSCTFDTLLLKQVLQHKMSNNIPTNIPTNFNQPPPCHVLFILLYFNLYSNKECQTKFHKQSSIKPHHVMYFHFILLQQVFLQKMSTKPMRV
jgi:hypothetical protein